MKQHIMLNRKKQKKHEGHVSMNFDESYSWQREALRLLEKALARSLCKRRTWKSLKITWKITDVCLAGAWPVVVAECVASLGLHCVDHIAASLFLGLQALKVEDESFVAELIHRAVRE